MAIAPRRQAEKRQGAEKVERGRWIKIMRKIPDVNVREAALREERLITSSVPDRDMAGARGAALAALETVARA